MARSKISNNTKLDADLVVIGGGAAGLPAAVTAMENGAKKVILLEKRLNVGGNASRAEGLFGAGSRATRKAYIDSSIDTIYKNVMEYHHFSRVDPLIFRAYLKKSGETIDWLEDKGIVFRVGTGTRMRFNQNPTWHIPEGNCASIVVTLRKWCKDLGVQTLLRTSAKKILLDSQGKVSGVLAVNQDNEEFRISTKSVIISTGGFTGNRELLKKYFPFYNDAFVTESIPHTGDGIRLAADAGAMIEDYACMLKETGIGNGALIFCIMREPDMVCVNKNGERFIGEDDLAFHPMEGGNVVIRQPGMIFYVLFDEKIEKRMEKEGLLVGRPGVHRWGDCGIPLSGLKKEMEGAEYRDWIKIADTWDEIAKWIGVRPETLKGTIAEYNSSCNRGYDETYVKDRKYLIPLKTPPFYAARVQPMMTDTIGPVRINASMQALNKQNEQIGRAHV
jgi:fumarate reductase flavoprotein subunit